MQRHPAVCRENGGKTKCPSVVSPFFTSRPNIPTSHLRALYGAAMQAVVQGIVATSGFLMEREMDDLALFKAIVDSTDYQNNGPYRK
jgi:hypothetical protein